MNEKPDGKRLIASCSFGKDSLAAIITAEAHGFHIDEAVYCRIMFDDTISAELPEHEDFIHSKAIPLLKSRYGIKTTIVQAKETYCSCFYKVWGEKSIRTGEIYGFPVRCGPWCNSRLKVWPIQKWQNLAGEYTAVVGIAADEEKRISRKTEKDNFLPLVEYGIVETDALKICKERGFLSPAYRDGRERLGCWFCHNQKIAELKRLRKEHPELWARLLELDAVSPQRFTQRSTVKQFDERFAREDAQLTIFDFLEVKS